MDEFLNSTISPTYLFITNIIQFNIDEQSIISFAILFNDPFVSCHFIHVLDGSSQCNKSWMCPYFHLNGLEPTIFPFFSIILERILKHFIIWSTVTSFPHIYGLIWTSTTLIFVIVALGNYATYLTKKWSHSSATWSFDVSYLNLPFCSIYGYALLVAVVFYFLLQYLGSNASLVRCWCLWGYSVFILILSSVLLVIPIKFLRWLIIVLVGGASACFVALNLIRYIQGNDISLVIVASFVFQMGLALFIKICFFP
ncbi:hypothetical protein PVL29_015738 [Vitis rotundifolia]|uniref:Protein YIP n=1 Tax=Vitis rotundifolia TaxID=103349 RepID=A0AA38ZDG8_VITRO|nr:hypothetical protein PVL29_015738 [Vitis rotundifolia]